MALQVPSLTYFSHLSFCHSLSLLVKSVQLFTSQSSLYFCSSVSCILSWSCFLPTFYLGFCFSHLNFRSSLSTREISLLSVIYDATLYSQFVLCLLMLFTFFCHEKVLYVFLVKFVNIFFDYFWILSHK